MKLIKGDLILTENTIFNEDLKVEGNIRCEGGRWNIKAWNINAGNINAEDINAWEINTGNINAGNINARNINAWEINARNINAWEINARNINAEDINAEDIKARDINAGDINFYAVAIAYKSFKCKSWKARRDNYVIKCLDGDIEIKEAGK